MPLFAMIYCNQVNWLGLIAEIECLECVLHRTILIL